MTILRIGGQIARIGGAIARPQRLVHDFEGGDYALATFGRVGAGTAFRADGTLAEFASGAARVTDAGLLLEGAATNLFPQWRTTTWNPAGSAPPAAPVAATVDGYPCVAVTFEAAGDARGYAVCRARAVAQATVLRGSAFTVQTMMRLSRPLEPGEHVVVYWTGTGGMAEWRPRGVEWERRTATSTFGGEGAATQYPVAFRASALGSPVTVYLTHHQAEQTAAPSSPIPTAGASATRGADSASLIVPAGCTAWSAVFGAGRIEVGGSGLTPGAAFDLVAGRPWIGVGNELKRVRFRA